MNDASAFPSTTHALASTVTDDGSAYLTLREEPLPAPGPDQVVVRIEAAPINPSDLGLLFAQGDIARAESAELAGHAALRIPLSDAALAANGSRVGQDLPAGNEGGGTVVAAGSSDAAQALLGRVVGFVSGSTYAQYRTVPAMSCLPMPDGVTPEQAAAPFVNPLTALGMVETMRREGHSALIHTVGASNLGQMLNRICLDDGVPLVNIVRRDDHVDLLQSQGAQHVVNSSADSFADDLHAALDATKATIAFDAIGGGHLASTILETMEKVASAGAEFSRYGSSVRKQVYIYGGLDRSPTVLQRTFGLGWNVGGWLLTPFLAEIGVERAGELRERVAAEITTTFASEYGLRVSLAEAIDPDVARRYGKMATGDKALIVPHG